VNRDLGLLILRAGAGVLMMSHGWGKVMSLASGSTEFADPVGLGPLPSLALAAFAEFLCALLVVVGWKTVWAAVPLVVTMAVAAFVVHGPDPLQDKELALVYLVVFVALAFTRAGRWSVDEQWSRRGRRRARSS